MEHHLTEGAVMVAFAMHLLQSVENLRSVTIHPDGEHGKHFDFRKWLESHGYVMTKEKGRTNYGGTYLSAAGVTVIVDPSSGRGDVLAELNGARFSAECKGGIVNTTHPGQKSRLYRGLCEAVGLLLATPLGDRQKQFAVVPGVPVTQELAKRLLPRVRSAGIEIALVDRWGNVSTLS